MSDATVKVDAKAFGTYDIPSIGHIQFLQTAGDTYAGSLIPQVDIRIDWEKQSLSGTISDSFAGESRSCTTPMPVYSGDFKSLVNALTKATVEVVTTGKAISGALTHTLSLVLNDGSQYQFGFSTDDQYSPGQLIVDNGSGLQELLQEFSTRSTCN